MALLRYFGIKRQFFALVFTAVAFLGFIVLFFVITMFFTAMTVHAEELTAQEQQEKDEKEQELEEEKDELEDEQEKLEKKLKKEQAELEQYQQQYGSASQQYSAAAAEVTKTRSDIVDKEADIVQYEKKAATLEQQTKIKQQELSVVMRELYYENNALGAVEEIADDESPAFLVVKDYFSSFRARAATIINDLQGQQRAAIDAKEKVEDVKEAKEQLLSVQRVQEQSLATEKARAQQEVARQEATVGELNSELSKIKSSLSSLLGESVSAGDIEEAAKIASKATGVRKDFILGMLTQETNLGRFTGGCTYKNANMNPADVSIFKDIAKDLDLNYKKVKVSCSASYGYGGAMGVAQFIPRTWRQYESSIAKRTGHNPPDPWSLVDGVMGMAIKLANDGATKKSGENTAARRYYCGSNLSRSVCKNYASSVEYWAKNYERLL